MYIGEYMHTNVITVGKHILLSDAQRIMSDNKIRRLPVVDRKYELIGLVTQDRMRETIKHPGIHIKILDFIALLSKLKVEDVMVTDVITVTPDTTIEEAVALGQQHRIGTLPVVEGKKLVGICTTTDLYEITAQILGFGKPGARVRVFNAEELPITEIAAIIAERNVRVLSMVHATPPGIHRSDCILHLDIDDASEIVNDFWKRGYDAEERRGRSLVAV